MMLTNRFRRHAAGRYLAAAMAVSWALAAAVPAGAQQAQAGAPLTLRQAVTRALANSRDLRLAELRYRVAERETGVTRSQFLPNLYAGSGAAYTSGFPLAASGGAPALINVTYQQEVFNPLARSDVRVAERRAEQQRLAMEAARDAVIVRVASAYLELAKVRRELELLRRGRESANRIVAITRQRTEAGLELPIEETRARLTAARIEQRIARLENRDETLSEDLRAQLGLALDQPVAVTQEDLPPAGDEAAATLVARALTNNVELRQALVEQQASADRLRGERGAFWPTLSFNGQYNVLARFNDYDVFFNEFRRHNVVAGVEIRIPLFAARTNAAVGLARANLEAAQAATENKRAEVSEQVRRQARQMREVEAAREVSRLELELAQQNVQVLQSQYQEGRAGLRDLEAAQLEQNDRWLAFLDAEFARQQTQLELLRLTGQVAQLFQ